jgi:hypothetical protein
MHRKLFIAFILTTSSSSCRTSSPQSSDVSALASGKAQGTLVLLSGQAHVLQGGVWGYPFGKEKFASDLQFYRGSKDYFFANVTDLQGEANKTNGWRWWNPKTSEIRNLVTPSKMHRPYRYLEPSKVIFKFEHFKYTEVSSEDDLGQRVEHAINGRFLYNYSQNGNYTYIDWPSIGQHESKYFSNLVPGKQMLLKMGDQKKLEVVLAAAPAILQPRFVADGKKVCYFKPGTTDLVKEEKTFLLECVGLDGQKRHYNAVREHLKGSRLPPTIWAFEGSPYILTHRYGPTHPAYRQSGPLDLIDVSGAAKPSRFNLGAGWMLVPQISARGAGVELEPYVVAIHKEAKKVRVLKLPDLSLALESDLPEHLDRLSITASYLP